ncbi:FAD-dependent monooxygenase [Streptomyces acidicola]|uniref:FAD-dependent monooxygenase n=1 Tax=Streptomyces acidicola TaxID=2596892 RepID=UPI003800E24A
MAGRLSIAVVGGGLAGLATAAALSRADFEVDVFEQAERLGEVGAGINISPQATKALTAIGLGDGLKSVGNAMTGQVQRSMYTGEQLAETRLTEDGTTSDRFGAPYYVFHRADLLDVLAGAVDSTRVHLGHRCTGLVEDGGEGGDANEDGGRDEDRRGVTLHFANGSRHRADIVIGADGIHSRIRRELYTEEKAHFTGQMVWRALVDGSALPAGILGPHGFCGWIGQGCHIMTYYLRGTSIINITTQSDAASWVEEGWSAKGDPDEMRSCFPGVAPPLRILLDEVRDCSKWGLFGREPSADWGRGRIQLIGDAAHPMLPNAGQGAAQAFEDAFVLARWLDESRDDPERALAEFRNVRIPRAHAIQRQSLLNSRLVHAGDWEKRQETFRARERRGDTPLGMNWIYGYDPETEWRRRQEYPLSFAPAEDAHA